MNKEKTTMLTIRIKKTLKKSIRVFCAKKGFKIQTVVGNVLEDHFLPKTQVPESQDAKT